MKHNQNRIESVKIRKNNDYDNILINNDINNNSKIFIKYNK